MSLIARIALLSALMLGVAGVAVAQSDELTTLRAKAERGNALAQYNLGLAYIQGRFGPTDPAEAFAWLSLAAENGATGKALDSLLGNITDQQLADGRKRLDTYRAALARSTAITHPNAPKLAPRGFSIETSPPATTPAETPAAPLTKAPEPVPPPAPASPVDGDDFASEAFAWLSLASETGTTSKALDRVLANITDKQLAEGRRRLEAYRTALAAKVAAANRANPPKPASAEAPAAPALPATGPAKEGVTSPADGADLNEVEKARADLSAANTELANLRASVARLEAAAAEAAAKNERLNTELTEARQATATPKPPGPATRDTKPPPDNPPAPKP